jgi:hypothetical protein
VDEIGEVDDPRDPQGRASNYLILFWKRLHR